MWATRAVQKSASVVDGGSLTPVLKGTQRRIRGPLNRTLDIAAAVLIGFLAQSAHASGWHDDGSPGFQSANGFGWTENELTSDGSSIYAIRTDPAAPGGSFVSRLTSPGWQQLGGEIRQTNQSTTSRHAITFGGGSLYVAQQESNSGGPPALFAYRWNGSIWSSVGGTVSPPGWVGTVVSISIKHDGADPWISYHDRSTACSSLHVARPRGHPRWRSSGAQPTSLIKTAAMCL